MNALHAVAYQALKNCVIKADKYYGYIPEYLDEVATNSYGRKQALLEDHVIQHTLHYDFLKLHEVDYNADPSKFYVPEGVEICYKPNQRIIAKHNYLVSVEPNQEVRWRKLLFEPEVDRNDQFCRLMEMNGVLQRVKGFSL